MFKLILSFLLLCSFGPLSAQAIEQTSDDRQLKAIEDQALAAENNHAKYASNLWSQIANRELAAGLKSEALEHEHHAIQLYSAQNVEEHFGPLGYMGRGVVYGLAQQGRSEDAEKLLIEAVERVKNVAGPKSIATQAQIEELFGFYAHQGNHNAAMRALDQVMDFDLGSGETPSQSLMHHENVTARYQPRTAVEVVHQILLVVQDVEKTEFSFAVTVTKKVLNAQAVYLAADDERLVETLVALADAYFYAKKYKEADGYYNRAYEISKQYHVESPFTVQQCGQNFLANLKEVGRAEEADRLSKLPRDKLLLQGKAFPPRSLFRDGTK